MTHPRQYFEARQASAMDRMVLEVSAMQRPAAVTEELRSVPVVTFPFFVKLSSNPATNATNTVASQIRTALPH